MDTITVKQVLAFLRGGHFSHPGEEEAIELTMGFVPKNPSQSLLDVGCGLGETSQYLQDKGWGKVTGIDISPAVISFARKHYPELEFHQCDILDADKLFSNKKFDVMCLFSSFLCCQSHTDCLSTLSRITNKNGELILFDYAISADTGVKSPFIWSTTSYPFYPVDTRHINQMLTNTGWVLKSQMDITPQMCKWYEDLMLIFDKKRGQAVELFGESAVTTVYQAYQKLLRDLKRKDLEGIIIHAVKVN